MIFKKVQPECHNLKKYSCFILTLWSQLIANDNKKLNSEGSTFWISCRCNTK